LTKSAAVALLDRGIRPPVPTSSGPRERRPSTPSTDHVGLTEERRLNKPAHDHVGLTEERRPSTPAADHVGLTEERRPDTPATDRVMFSRDRRLNLKDLAGTSQELNR